MEAFVAHGWGLAWPGSFEGLPIEALCAHDVRKDIASSRFTG